MGVEEGEGNLPLLGTQPMFTAIIIALIVLAVLGFALRLGRDGGAIAHRPYNNRYNDASGARDETFG
jgi:hypothetical protein